MAAWAWILVMIAMGVGVGVAVWFVTSRRRTAHLQERSGPEYQRVVSSVVSRREAEAELDRREERREAFEIRPLSAASRAQFVQEWSVIQAEFVDQPSRAVARADSSLVADLMQRITSKFGAERERLEKLWAEGDDVSTEHLRVALTSYRSFFDKLLST